MKIMLVGSDTGMSGAGLSMIKLANELENQGLDVIRVVRKGNTQRILDQENVKYYEVNAQSWILSLGISKWRKISYRLIKKLLNSVCYFQYCKIIKREHPDVIHINAITTYLVAKAALKYNIPIVWHIREFLEEDLGGEFWNKRKAVSLLSKASYFIAISDSVKEKYTHILPGKNIVRIYNGIDMDMFYLPEHRILENESVCVTVAGRITEKKGQYKTLRELKDLLRKNPRIILKFAGVGSKEYISEMKEYIEENNIDPHQVEFLGYVSDMRSLWNRTDIAVVYSECEAFGRVTIEAMAAGSLVMGYNAGATKELIKNGVNGYLFGENGNSNLNLIMQDILQNPYTARSVAERGRDEVKDLFTSRRNAEEVIKVYEQVSEGLQL